MRLLLTIGLLLLLAWPAQAITRNSATSSACSGNPNPCTVAHTVAGADPFLAICVAVYHYLSTPTITSATWNGLALTLIDTYSNPSCGDKCTVALYGLANPGAATATVSIGTSWAYTGMVIGAVSYNGVDPTTPTGTAVRATGSGSPASVTVPSNSSEVVMDCLGAMAAGGVPSPASGQTSNWSLFDGGGFTHGASGYLPGSPSTVSAWTLTGSPPWAMLGVPIKPVAGSGGGGGSTPGTQRVISWTDNSDNEQYFHLQWKTDQSDPNWVDISAQIPANTVSYAHNIGTSTGDCYRIEATNAGGASGFTAPACAGSSTPPPPPPPPPSAAGGFFIDLEEDLL